VFFFFNFGALSPDGPNALGTMLYIVFASKNLNVTSRLLRY